MDFFVESDGNCASDHEQIASLQTIHQSLLLYLILGGIFQVSDSWIDVSQHLEPGFGFYFESLNDWDKWESVCFSFGFDSLDDEMAEVDDVSYWLTLRVFIVDLSEFGVGLADQLNIFIGEATRTRLEIRLF